MPAEDQKLVDVVQVDQRFQRSVNLEMDFAVDSSQNRYVVTPTATRALRRILEGLEGDGTARAMTLTGPYGAGKSAFALFLSRLLCSTEEFRQDALKIIRATQPDLARAFSESRVLQESGQTLFPVLITARRAPAPYCVLEGLSCALTRSNNKKLKLLGKRILEDALKQASDRLIDTRYIVEALTEVSSTTANIGYTGILVIVDELGKLFEYAARDPRGGDVYVLQEIAELASRSGDTPIEFIGILHQGFDEYARHLDRGTRQEWAKIQGRFIDVAFQEPTEQLVRLIASAIKWSADTRPPKFEQKLRKLARESIKAGIKPPILSDSEFEDLSIHSYPLHPITLVSLPILFNRFAQNERSLFSYLNSLEHGGFQTFIHTQGHDARSPSFIRLPQVFDYFTTNFGAGLYRQTYARKWLETADALDRDAKLTDFHRDIVKTIGVLSVLDEFSHLRATQSVLAVALNDAPSMKSSTKNKIQNLQNRSLLTFRKFTKSYRVWEGSDIDVEERIIEGERKVKRLGLANIVQTYLNTRPLVARRHSFNTGALRYFDLLYVDTPGDITLVKSSAQRADGRIFVCLANSSSDVDLFRKCAVGATDQLSTLFAIPQQIGDLRAAALELAALRWVWENTPELRDDRVARREVGIRISEAEQLLQRSISGLLDPRPEPIGSSCLWLSQGKKHDLVNRSSISLLLSDVCDRLYHKSPKLRNELVVRRTLSTAAAAARRNLVEAMLTAADQPNLGIKGYPPERSLYESVLAAPGLHGQLKDGTWGFRKPDGRKKMQNLEPCWQELSSIIFDQQPEPIPLTVLYEKLSAPPIGLLDGLRPIILAAFILANQDFVTLYRDGRLLPEPRVSDFEVLMRRPDFFALAGCRISGGRKAVIKRLARGLDVTPETVPVVRKLFNMIAMLPDYAHRTQEMPAETIRMREVFTAADSPEKFLFTDLPEALGVGCFGEEKSDREHREKFFSALNKNISKWNGIMSEAIKESRGILQKACGYPVGVEGWQAFRMDAVRIEPTVADPHMLTFIQRVSEASTDEGVEALLSLVSECPPHSWTDMDRERFGRQAASIGASFKKVRNKTIGDRVDELLDTLNAKEKRKATKIADNLHTLLYANDNNNDTKIYKVAVAILANKLEEEVSNE